MRHQGGRSAVVVLTATLLCVSGCTHAHRASSTRPTWPSIASSSASASTDTAASVTDHTGQSQFATPTRNIGCIIDDGNQLPPLARCDIHDHTWSPPPRPTSCHLDWAGGTVVGATGRGDFTCASDAAFVSSPVLAYGRGYREGRFTCISRSDGVTCTNDRTKHGFFISRETIRVF